MRIVRDHSLEDMLVSATQHQIIFNTRIIRSEYIDSS